VGDTGRRGDQILTQVFKLNHENANNLVPVLRPLISPNNTINANPGNNSLVITDYADNLQRIGKIIAAHGCASRQRSGSDPAEARRRADLAPIVQRLSEGSSGCGRAGRPGRRRHQFGDRRFAQQQRCWSRPAVRRAWPACARWSTRLDQPLQGSAAAGNVWVVHLKNADATKLAQVLRAAVSGAGGGGGSGGARRPPRVGHPGHPAGRSPPAAPRRRPPRR
jgi:general secretion pathway protein D